MTRVGHIAFGKRGLTQPRHDPQFSSPRWRSMADGRRCGHRSHPFGRRETCGHQPHRDDGRLDVAFHRTLIQAARSRRLDRILDALLVETRYCVNSFATTDEHPGDVFARDVSDRVLVMDSGVMVEQGNPQQIFVNPIHERMIALVR
jgi:hypothetical protein